jgi:hypothetical protein
MRGKVSSRGVTLTVDRGAYSPSIEKKIVVGAYGSNNYREEEAGIPMVDI